MRHYHLSSLNMRFSPFLCLCWFFRCLKYYICRHKWWFICGMHIGIKIKASSTKRHLLQKILHSRFSMLIPVAWDHLLQMLMRIAVWEHEHENCNRTFVVPLLPGSEHILQLTKVATMLHEPAEGNKCTWSLAFVVHGNNEENPKKSKHMAFKALESQ